MFITGQGGGGEGRVAPRYPRITSLSRVEMMKYYAVLVCTLYYVSRWRGGHYSGGRDGPFTSSVNDGAHFVDVIINLRRARGLTSSSTLHALYTSIGAIISGYIDWR